MKLGQVLIQIVPTKVKTSLELEATKIRKPVGEFFFFFWLDGLLDK